jgi:hypothetical protein
MQTRPLLSLILILVCTASPIIGQSPTPQQVGKSPLALLVAPNPDMAPNYHPLPDASGFMYSRFARIKAGNNLPVYGM